MRSFWEGRETQGSRNHPKNRSQKQSQNPPNTTNRFVSCLELAFRPAPLNTLKTATDGKGCQQKPRTINAAAALKDAPKLAHSLEHTSTIWCSHVPNAFFSLFDLQSPVSASRPQNPSQTPSNASKPKKYSNPVILQVTKWTPSQTLPNNPSNSPSTTLSKP